MSSFHQVMSTDEEDDEEREGGGLGEMRDDHLQDMDDTEDDSQQEFVQ